METSKLKKFAQFARRSLIEQVSGKLQQVLAEDSAARREEPKAVEELSMQIKAHGRDQVIEKAADTWFNRFCALRYMDVNRYTRIGVVSPAEGQFQPEILAEAKMGHIDEEMVPEKTRQQIFALLNGTTPSRDPQAEAYRLLVVAVCNDYHKAMDYLFEKIADYTELLMPDDLLSGNSILAYTREAMTPEACGVFSNQPSVVSSQKENTDNCTLMADGSAAGGVEVIGWLYQFYISEKKDEVFEGLKKNRKITPENIPAATQLFTPHWIVRYLVENSLGRLWMLNRPNSRLAEKMAYYIKPETPETDFLKISKPEEIKVCDPACGSAHMLVYSFDILYFIYEEEGYEASEIPRLILENNLFGIEIDKRAGELAAFALTMKARAKQRRFFSKKVAPNICVLENINFEETELKDYMDFIGWDLFTAPLQTTLRQFEESDNFGSLIRPKVTNVNSMLKILEEKNVSGQLFLSKTHKKVQQVLRQAGYLSPKYHVVITNPPYMGGKGMNGRLGAWLKDNYANVKSDLFSTFVARCSEFGLQAGHIGIMSPNVWMYISSYEKLRNVLTGEKTLTNLVELPLTGFKGATVQICAYNFVNSYSPDFQGGFIRLIDFKGGDDEMAYFTRQAINDKRCGWFYRSSSAAFNKIPGSPIAYWLSEQVLKCFTTSEEYLVDICNIREGINTGDNDRFLRLWQEVSFAFMQCGGNQQDELTGKWFPHRKGGSYRKWAGNMEHVVNWQSNGRDIHAFHKLPIYYNGAPVRGKAFFFKEALSWSRISSGKFSLRYHPSGSTYDSTAPSIFTKQAQQKYLLSFLNGKIVAYLLAAISPTLDFRITNLGRLPIIPINGASSRNDIDEKTKELIRFAQLDWDSHETSWAFTELPLLSEKWGSGSERQLQEKLSTSHFPLNTHIEDEYANLRVHWREITMEMQRLEQESNCIFIDAYGLKDELTPEVPMKEITLTCNPHYRYGIDECEAGSEKWEAMEALLLEDTLKEFISYSVGCMFGRYSLDMPGLVLANQGESVEDYNKKLVEWKKQQAGITTHSEITYQPDKDNVIPVLDDDWFTDDIVERFQRFLHLTFGNEHYETNLKFIEKALGKDIRKYFLKDFYNDHVRRYKKRPIYWLFSSPKGSFNALIYMHRHRPDTVSVVLNDYLREFRTKLISRKNHLEAVSISAGASQGEKTKALKEIETLKKMVNELEAYEREVMYPLATQQLEIDLDDGVKVNYLKFGTALKKIPGLDAKGEE